MDSNRRKNLLKFFKCNWHIFALFSIAVLSFGLNFYAISKNGVGNEYYAAAIKSMTQSFKNFFFVSFDPAGMVSVDKPPLALWIQALFVLVFGYHGWAMLLPQALAGTGSCILIYFLTKKYFGRAAGLVSSLLFAITPAVVVVSRNNTMDMQLIFVLLCAVWFLFKSIEKSKWRYLFLAAVFIGLGFNIKMLQAYTILPAFAVVYLIFSKQKFVKRLLSGIIATVIMAAVSFAWVVVVDLYPSSSRPYVDSSTNNTVLELIIGHNGLERLYGQGSGGGMGGGGGHQNGNPPSTMPGQNQNGTGGNFQGSQSQNSNGGNPPSMPGQNQNSTSGNFQGSQSQNSNGGNPPSMPGQNQNGNGQTKGGAQQGFGGPQSGGGSMGFGGGRSARNGGSDIGTASIVRLWSSNLYGQASWLLIFTLFGIMAFIKKPNLRNPELKYGALTMWAVWLATMFIFFSFAGFYHQYYLCMLAPQIAILSGTGLVEMIRHFKDRSKIKQYLLPVSLITTLAFQIYHVWSYSELRTTLFPIMLVAGVLALLFIAFYYFKPKRQTLCIVSIFTIVSLIAAPFYWALTPVMYVPNATMPYAGPELASQNDFGGRKAKTGDSTVSKLSGLEKYLVSNYKAGSYLVVSQRASDVARYIIDTGLPAVAYGGFLGSDNSMTVSKLKQLVAEGKVTYFLVSGEGGGSNSELITYVKQHATLIDPSKYGGTSSGEHSSLYCFTKTSS